MQRRLFLKDLIQGAVAAVAMASPVGSVGSTRSSHGQRYLRPPGALPEEEFVARCIHCGQCSEVCPNRCIQYFGYENGIASIDTPYIIPREQACILCMKCGEVCPTDAIQKITRELDPILKGVKMGHAVVNKNLCLSYQGKTCGVCYRACPLADIAIRVGLLEQPHVMEACVGCGLCERSCIQIPQAIKIIPNHENKQA